MFERSLILALIVVASSYGQSASLSSPGQTLSPGQTVVTSLSLASAGQPIAAIQFDLQWEQPLSLQITAGDQLRAASKIPYAVFLAPGTVRCLIAGINKTPIADGELLKIFLSADPASSAGAAQVKIANISSSNPGGSAVPVSAGPINVQIQNVTVVQFLPANAVLNAASLSPGPLSPGEIITVLGFNALPTVSVRIDGTPAPVLYASANQINAIVPFELDPASPASLEITGQNQKLTLSLPVAAATPGLFTLSGTGLGPGAVLNQDYTVNSFSNPAPAGSIVMIYGTGFGALTALLADGQAASNANSTILPVTATVAGLPANVLYAGAAPGLVAGAIQANVRLPAGLTHSLTTPVVLTVNGSSTSNAISVAIQ